MELKFARKTSIKYKNVKRKLRVGEAIEKSRIEGWLNGRIDFAKEILDMLDEVVRGTNELESFIRPIQASIRELRDK